MAYFNPKNLEGLTDPQRINAQKVAAELLTGDKISQDILMDYIHEYSDKHVGFRSVESLWILLYILWKYRERHGKDSEGAFTTYDDLFYTMKDTPVQDIDMYVRELKTLGLIEVNEELFHKTKIKPNVTAVGMVIVVHKKESTSKFMSFVEQQRAFNQLGKDMKFNL